MSLANNKGSVAIIYTVFPGIRLGMNGEEYYKSTSFKRAKEKERNPIWVKRQFLLLSVPFRKLTCRLSEKGDTEHTES